MTTKDLFTKYNWEYKWENNYITFKRKSKIKENYDYVFITCENKEVYIQGFSLPIVTSFKLSAKELKLFIEFGEEKFKHE